MQKHRRNIGTTFLAIAAVAFLFSLTNPHFAAAENPLPKIQYIGKLTDPNGVAVANGTYQMKFALYRDGGCLWGAGVLVGDTTGCGNTEQSRKSVSISVQNGFFSVYLGDSGQTALPDALYEYDSDAFTLGVTVCGVGDTPITTTCTESEMTPRKDIGTAPLANRAKFAERSQNDFYVSNNLSVGVQDLTAGNPVPFNSISGGLLLGEDYGIEGTGTASFAGTDIATAGVSSLGSKILWNPSKGAFRAGSIGDMTVLEGFTNGSAYWDAANVGPGSFAAGINSRAGGASASAFGLETNASGLASTVMGMKSTASGGQSFAAGFLNTASGDSSIALGGESTASGGSAIALGSSVTASANNTIAIGSSLTASANNAIAIGSGFTNNTASTFKVGFNNGSVLTVTNDTVDVTGTLTVNGSPIGGGSTLSALTAATSTNNIGNGNYSQTWGWNFDGTGSGWGIKMEANGAGSAILELSGQSAFEGSPLYVMNTGLGNAAYFDNRGTGLNGNNKRVVDAASFATFNTTGGSLTNYAGYFNNTSSRSTGGNDLTNVGLYASASGAQNNYAAIFENGRIGIGTTAPSYDLSFSGNGEKIIGLERQASPSDNGQALMIRGGGAKAGIANQTGGNLTLSTGIATGNGGSNIEFMTAGGGNSGTGDKDPSTRLTIDGTGNTIYQGDLDIAFGIGEKTGSGPGGGLTVKAGRAKTSESNTNGGNLTLTSGIATGSGTSKIYLQVPQPGNSGTSDTSMRSLTLLGTASQGIFMGLSQTGGDPARNIDLFADEDQTIGMGRVSGAWPGKGLTINAGGGQSGGTDQSGGDLVLTSGISTGSGTSNILFKTPDATTTGTTDRTPQTKMAINGVGVGIGTANPSALLEVGKTASVTGITYPPVPLQISQTYNGNLVQGGTLYGINNFFTSDVNGNGNAFALIGTNSTLIVNSNANTVTQGAFGTKTLATSADGTLTLPSLFGTYSAAQTGSEVANVTTAYGVYGVADNLNGGTMTTGYGGYFKADAASTSVGMYATATGGGTKYAGIFDVGNVGINNTTPSVALTIGGGSGTTAAAGLNFGEASSNLYRSAANTIKTDGTLNVATKLGVGTSTINSGLTTLSYGNTNATVSIANSALELANTSGSGQTMLSTSFNGVLKSAWRFDYAGNINYSGIGYHAFYTQSSTFDDTLALQVMSTGVAVGQYANPPGGQLAVYNQSASRVGLFIKGAGSQSANLLTITSSADATLFGVSSTGRTTVNATVASSTAGLCWSGTEGSAQLEDCNGAPSDLAEWYETDGTVSEGDLVALGTKTVSYQGIERDPNNFQKIIAGEDETVPIMVKSSTPYQSNITGVISSAPYQILGEDLKKKSAHPLPLALAGRVPVKVTAENGAIAPGDYLTSSSTPGTAMKATQAGTTVGMALESFNGQGTGKVLMLVNLNQSAAATAATTPVATTTTNSTTPTPATTPSPMVTLGTPSFISGRAELTDALKEVIITLPTNFSDAVGGNYQAFITSTNTPAALFIASQTATAFTVRSMDGVSFGPFNWMALAGTTVATTTTQDVTPDAAGFENIPTTPGALTSPSGPLSDVLESAPVQTTNDLIPPIAAASFAGFVVSSGVMVRAAGRRKGLKGYLKSFLALPSVLTRHSAQGFSRMASPNETGIIDHSYTRFARWHFAAQVLLLVGVNLLLVRAILGLAIKALA